MQEIHGVHPHQFMHSPMPVVLPVVGDHASFCTIFNNARVTDGNTIGITANVFQHLVDTFGWWTAIYNPSLLKALLANNLWNDNLLLTQTRREHGHELGPEHLAQRLHWKKEIPGILGASLQMMPHTIFIHTATCYDAVDVRMVEEVGAPCMEYACHSPLQPMALIELPQGVPCGTEHAGVEQPLMQHGYRMQAVRNGEDHVEVLHARHHLFLAHLYPHLAFLVLALGTMTVSAAVVADMDVATLGADLHMPPNALVRQTDIAEKDLK